MFEKLRSYIEETNSSNSINDKLKVLEKHKDDKDLQKVFYYTYNPFLQFRVSVANLNKRKDLASVCKYDSLFDLLDDLHNLKLTGHDAISAVNGFINANKTYEKEINYVINRNLETRITSTLINRVIPKLVPGFDVALCEDYDKQKDKNRPKFETVAWYASRKLDGLRALAVIDPAGDAVFYSRSGKEFKTFGKVAEEIKKLGIKNMVLDGEMCLLTKDGDDDFAGMMKEYSRKDHTVENPKYRIFDCLTQLEFESCTSTAVLTERLQRLDFLKGSGSVILAPLRQDKIVSQAHFEEMRVHADEKGWEGLIIRKDAVYEGKRSKNMLKVKKFLDAEYIVESIASDIFRAIVDDPTSENGKKEVDEVMLAAVKIKHRDNEVSVGSGFSMEQRRLYHKNPNLIVGKTITVKYFEETLDQNGKYSLRFPTLKAIFDDGRDV